MGKDIHPDRRQFLALASVSTAGLAGCAALEGQEEGDGGPDADGPDASGPESPELGGDTRSVALIVQPNPTALQEAQTEVVTALEEDELTQEEAEAELAEQEQELIETAIADASARIDEVGAVHADTVEAEGTLLVEGEAGSILDLLEQPSVSAVLEEERFEQAQQRAGGGPSNGLEDLPDEPDEGMETDPEE